MLTFVEREPVGTLRVVINANAREAIIRFLKYALRGKLISNLKILLLLTGL